MSFYALSRRKSVLKAQVKICNFSNLFKVSSYTTRVCEIDQRSHSELILINIISMKRRSNPNQSKHAAISRNSVFTRLNQSPKGSRTKYLDSEQSFSQSYFTPQSRRQMELPKQCVKLTTNPPFTTYLAPPSPLALLQVYKYQIINHFHFSDVLTNA